MQLYSAANSSFGARVTLAARAKGIEIETVALPAGGLRSAQFLALNPLAKIPVLVTDDRLVLPESDTIVRHIEACHPKPSLFPSTPAERAIIERTSRIVDLYVAAPIIRLFPQLEPKARDERVVESEIGHWRRGLAALAHFLPSPLPAVAAGLSFADCMLAPIMHLGTRIAAMLDLSADPMTSHRELTAYYVGICRHPIAGPIIEALTLAQEHKDLQYGLASLAHHHRTAAARLDHDPATGAS